MVGLFGQLRRGPSPQTPPLTAPQLPRSSAAAPQSDRVCFPSPPPPRASCCSRSTADVGRWRGAGCPVDGREISTDATARSPSWRDAICRLFDLPRGAIPDSALRALDAFVRDGGGLLVTGGPRAFGPGNWEGSPLEPLLPLRLDLPQRRDEPALALAIIIDRSGSMSGAKMDLTKRAARATAEMLPPTTRSP